MTFFTYKGRMSRRQYLKYPLLIFITSLIIIIGRAYALTEMLHGSTPDTNTLRILSVVPGVILLLWVILSFPTVKRLHDINFSGWVYLLLLITPVYNVLSQIYPTLYHLNNGIISEIKLIIKILFVFIFFILFFQKGTKGANDYGPDPLATNQK